MLIDVLFWVSIFSGGILILMMLLSLVGGLDLDIDLDLGSPEVETDAGGLGIIKGLLTFISTSSWVMKILVGSNQNIGIAIGVGIFVGFISLLLLSYVFKALLKNQSYVNWEMNDALYQKGQVYLKIPASTEQSGIVQIEINGATREIKAKSKDNKEINTGDSIMVVDIDGDYVLVTNDI